VEPGVIVVEGLCHRYPSTRKGSPERMALDQVSFTVQPREFFALLGPNGGGKSTLFHILSTFFTPTSGRALIFGNDVALDAESVRRRIGVVFQSPALDPVLTVEENLIHQGHLYGLRGADLRLRLRELTTRFGVADRLKDSVKTLSGGLKRRVELAKGLLSRPELLLLDEPSTGLDPAARLNLRQTLKELSRQDGLTVLLTTHFMEEAEACDRVAILDQGRLVALGTPAELKAAVPKDAVLQRLKALQRDEATLEDVFMSRTGHSFE